MIEHVSSIMTLEVFSTLYPPIFGYTDEQLQEGDLLLTGTPSGVGPVEPGDEVTAAVSLLNSTEALSSVSFTAVQREEGYQFVPESS